MWEEYSIWELALEGCLSCIDKSYVEASRLPLESREASGDEDEDDTQSQSLVVCCEVNGFPTFVDCPSF